MKTKISTLMLAWVFVGCFAQGTVRFDNNIPGVLVTHVYLPRDDSGFYRTGNGPNDFPLGTANWTGWAPVSGTGYSAQIWAALGNAPQAALEPSSPITTFGSDSAAGFFSPMTGTLSGIPTDASFVTLEIRVWDNQGGTVNSWVDAIIHNSNLGFSELLHINHVGGGQNPPPVLEGLTSFNLVGIPEPSTFFFGITGVFLFWLLFPQDQKH